MDIGEIHGLTGGACNCASRKFTVGTGNFRAPTNGERSSPEEERALRRPQHLLQASDHPFASSVCDYPCFPLDKNHHLLSPVISPQTHQKGLTQA